MKIIAKFFKVIINMIFIIWLFINTVLIIKSIIFPNEVPSFLGYKPFIVVSGSVQTDVRLGDFVVSKNEENLVEGDVVVVKTDKRKATTYSIKSIDENNLKLENDTGDFLDLSKDSIEGKMVLDIRTLGEIFLLMRNPIIITIFLILGIILGICIYKIKLLW